MAKIKGRVFLEYIQALGKSLSLPISLLPVGGLLLGVGSSFTNASTIAMFGLEGILGEGTLLNGLFSIMYLVGNTIIDNLAIMFAMAIALGLAKAEKAVAVLASVVSFLAKNPYLHTGLKNPYFPTNCSR